MLHLLRIRNGFTLNLFHTVQVCKWGFPSSGVKSNSAGHSGIQCSVATCALYYIPEVFSHFNLILALDIVIRSQVRD